MNSVQSVCISCDASTGDITKGVLGIEGILRLEREELWLEYRLRKFTDGSLLNIKEASVTKLQILLEELEFVQFKKSIFGDKIVLRANRLTTFQELPISGQAQAMFKTTRADREQAAELVRNLNLYLSELRLQRLDENNHPKLS